MAIQHDMLIGHGLDGSFQPTICKLVLGKHGYQDKQELTGTDGKDLIPEVNSDIEAVRRIAFAFAKARSLEDAADKE